MSLGPVNTKSAVATASEVLRLGQLSWPAVAELLQRFGLKLVEVPLDQAIPGSYWGECEAGLIGHELYCRLDTPIHSVLHEGCHFICMDGLRRGQLHTDAGGQPPEENAVCLLQILLADHVPGVGRDRLMQDMDTWGYTFRLGSARAWFTEESQDAWQWLQAAGLIDASGALRWQVRA